MCIAKLSGNNVLINNVKSKIDIRRFADNETGCRLVNEDLLIKFFNYEQVLGKKGTVLNCVRENGSKTSAHYPDAEAGARAIDYRNLNIDLCSLFFVAAKEIQFSGIGLYVSRQPHKLPFIHVDTLIDLERRGRPPLFWYRDNSTGKYIYFKNACKCFDAYGKLYKEEIKKYV